eukprot:TRINITY_DN51864_c0_g1_i2.p1 TRINITY_DN51864_c0_g1~~TRINITY_DN51864_c0_g1_i2.p1  ORF type:complete len:450 (-),score=312.47 TRINITY_DN51864_c0_g1_i2:49-1398(-)
MEKLSSEAGFAALSAAVSLSDAGKKEQAIAAFADLLNAPEGDASVKVREECIYNMGRLYTELGRTADVRELLVKIRPFFASIPKARTAKIVKTLIDLVGEVPNSTALQADLCRESIEWCRREKRSFLRQRIEARLCGLLLVLRDYKEAIKVITALVRDVKKIDDKLLLLEIHLIESRVHHALQNLPKAKGALTAARSNANAIYCPPNLQVQIDMQAGVLCAEEKDYKTAFSYFYEAFEGNNTADRPDEAVKCLKYMLLSKIMTNSTSDVYSIVNSKSGVKYAGIEVRAMKAVADALKQRSIHAYQRVAKQYAEQLEGDDIVHSHLNQLYENLLEQNLIRIIEPFSRVEIAHVAKLIRLPVALVEGKLSAMILDKKLDGILDQGAGNLIVYDKEEADETFDAALQTIKELGNVIDKLDKKANSRVITSSSKTKATASAVKATAEAAKSSK